LNGRIFESEFVRLFEKSSDRFEMLDYSNDVAIAFIFVYE